MKSRVAIVFVLGLTGAIASEFAYAVDLLKGQRLYNMHCAVCHGMNGVPVIQQAPNFATKERLMQPDTVLVQSVKMGKNSCPPRMGILKDEEIFNVIYYARTLR